MNSKNEKPIVSVAVITYNSATTVLETLDSIVSQTYGPENIELIISDDGSKDNTVMMIGNWLALHGNKFHFVSFFSNKNNSGVSKNCNIAWKAATSEWIKTIAGDDILLSNCLEDNIDFVYSHGDVSVLFSTMQSFEVNDEGIKTNRSLMPSKDDSNIFSCSAREQYKYLQRRDIAGAPSAFINRAILNKIGFADERFRMIEDHPLWFKITSSGFKLHFMNKTTVCYRLGNSISRSKSVLINEAFVKEIINIDEKLIIPSLERHDFFLIFRKRLWTRLSLFVSRFFKNRVNFISRLLMLSVLAIKPGFLKFQIHKLKNII